MVDGNVDWPTKGSLQAGTDTAPPGKVVDDKLLEVEG
jgi:hypothetical protein